jgi:hypothetical protein
MQYSHLPAEIVERIRRQVSLSALEGLAVKLGSLREGRKAIILVSEGYTAMLPPQLRDPSPACRASATPPRQSAGGENSLNEERAQFFRRVRHAAGTAATCSTPPTATTRPSTRSTRAGCPPASSTSPTTSACGRARSHCAQTMDTLRVLAEKTDGRAIVNRNDLARGMQQIVRDSSAYYLLGYNSSRPRRTASSTHPRAREAAGRAGARAQGLLGAVG